VVTHTQGSLSLLLVSCVLATSVSLPALADGNGVIVIDRHVNPYAIGRTRGVDPYPTTANANPSAQIATVTSVVLSDNDFAGITTGASITRSIMPNGDITGLNNIGGGIGLGAGSAPGHSGGGISGTINSAVSRGLEPLNGISGMVGGAMK
jgi:hypothetical protein